MISFGTKIVLESQDNCSLITFLQWILEVFDLIMSHNDPVLHSNGANIVARSWWFLWLNDAWNLENRDPWTFFMVRQNNLNEAEMKTPLENRDHWLLVQSGGERFYFG